MPKELHDKLVKQGKKKGLSGKELDAYVYGTMRKTGWKPNESFESILEKIESLFETNKVYTANEVQTIQSKHNPSSDIIFDMTKSDTFELINISISDINAPNNLSYEFYYDNDLDEDLSIVHKLVNLLQKGVQLTPIVVDENFKIMDGLHRYVAYDYLNMSTISVFKRISGE